MVQLALAVLLGMTTASAAPVSADPGRERMLAYGRHLASECTTCHQIDGKNEGIPGIIGWPVDVFSATMLAYRDPKFAERRNPVMVSVARSLNEQEIEALATYFESLKPRVE